MKEGLRIPIKEAKRIAYVYGYDQVLIFAWNNKNGIQHITTYGKSIEDCDQIAQGGNYIKDKLLGWPENECCSEPYRVKKLKEEILKLRREVDELRI